MVKVTDNGVVHSLFQCIRNEIRDTNIHICNPHRKNILAAKKFVCLVIFETAGSFSGDYFIKIIFHIFQGLEPQKYNFSHINSKRFYNFLNKHIKDKIVLLQPFYDIKMNNENSEHRAGFVNLIGNPNVGKSTLMNQLVGERLSIITAKAQTTRHRIKGIVDGENFQIIYSDLPGILTPAYKMQEMMMKFVSESLQDADLILYLVECGETKYDEQVISKLQKINTPILLVFNKIDKATSEQIDASVQHWTTLLPLAEPIQISALEGRNLDVLLQKIIEKLPVCPPYFPKDQLTDRPMRFFVSEIIREKILLLYKKEIPYSVEVVVDEYKETDDLIRIMATLYVERDTQKGIVIGNKGAAIKKLGIESRTAIEEFLDKHVYLDLSVKVLKDWRNNDLIMKKFGYNPA